MPLPAAQAKYNVIMLEGIWSLARQLIFSAFHAPVNTCYYIGFSVVWRDCRGWAAQPGYVLAFICLGAQCYRLAKMLIQPGCAHWPLPDRAVYLPSVSFL